jgi:hypothetical protein
MEFLTVRSGLCLCALTSLLVELVCSARALWNLRSSHEKLREKRQPDHE